MMVWLWSGRCSGSSSPAAFRPPKGATEAPWRRSQRLRSAKYSPPVLITLQIIADPASFSPGNTRHQDDIRSRPGSNLANKMPFCPKRAGSSSDAPVLMANPQMPESMGSPYSPFPGCCCGRYEEHTAPAENAHDLHTGRRPPALLPPPLSSAEINQASMFFKQEHHCGDQQGGHHAMKSRPKSLGDPCLLPRPCFDRIGTIA